MKRLANAALLVAALAAAPAAIAQVPTVQVYWDKGFTQTVIWPQGVGVVDTVYVVASNFNMFMSTIEFSIAPPTEYAVWSGDVHLPGSLHLGQSNTGVTITYPIPLNAFLPVAVMKYEITYLRYGCPSICDVCPPVVYDQILVEPHPYTGLIEAIEWNTYRAVQGAGMSTRVCPYPISTEHTTWGRVKSLYQ